MTTRRAELLEQLERIVAWLDASPPGDIGCRTLTIEVGVSARHRATVELDATWCGPGESVRSNVHRAQGRTLGAALRRLHVPAARKRRR